LFAANKLLDVFDELDAESREKGEPALKARLIDTSVEAALRRSGSRGNRGQSTTRLPWLPLCRLQ
jgi:hypothetical protein